MYREDDLISRTEELLSRTVDSEIELLPQVPDDDPEGVAGKFLEDPVEASVEVSLSKDAMVALATLYPPRGIASPLLPEMVEDQLERAGVTFGVRDELLSEAVFACNTERTVIHSIEIAQGRLPVHAMEGHYALIYETPVVQPRERGGRIDHHKRSRLPIISAGSVIARYVPPREGMVGTTVTGREIPFGTVSHQGVEGGENTLTTNGEITAAIDGILSIDGRTVSVSPVLEVRKDVDYGTGNIDFDGNVILHGTVADGFTISCSGLLRAYKTIDAYGITCGSLEVQHGVIGHHDALVNVRGPVTARFLQNIRIESQGTVTVGTSILAFHVTAGECIRSAKGSTVMGSVLRAQYGVDVFNIGAPGGAVSEIYLGIDFEVDRRLAEIRDNTFTLSEHLRKVRSVIKRSTSPEEKLLQTEKRLVRAIAALGQTAGDLVTKLDKNEEAALIVRGTVHAGTYVEICHRSFHVDRTMKNCRITLDKNRGAIVAEPIELRKTNGYETYSRN